MRQKFINLVIVLIVLFTLAGCGYSVRGNASKYKTIYVAPFKNSINFTRENAEYSRYKSYFPLMESTITQKTVDRFIFDSNIRISKEDQAEVILKGELIDYQRTPLRYASNNEDVEEYRITVWVNMELYDAENQKVEWTKNNFAGESDYEITGSRAKSEKQALSDAIDDLARRIVEAVTESQEW